MSDRAAWQAAPLTPEMRATHFVQSKSFAGEVARTGRAYRRTGFVVGTAGMVIGVAGMLCAVLALSRPAVPPRWIEVDRSTGWVGETLGPTDAPKTFNERVIEAALRSYVEDREAFVPEADDLAFHRVALRSAPDEQGRYAAAHDPKHNANAPFVVYGRGGFARVENFHMTKRGEDAKTGTFDYAVHFFKTEVKAGQVGSPKPWTAELQFQFHPELPMALQDRQINETGLQVIAYNSFADEVSKP